MPECPETFPFTIPIIRFTMEDDRPANSERQQTKKMSLLTPVKIEVPDAGRRSSEPTRYYIPPQCNNKLSPRAARKHDNRRRSKSNIRAESPCNDTFGPKPCNCEDCRASSPLPPGYGPPTMSPGYDQMKSSLLEVPWTEDFTEASSDDLSSEWDSDAPEPVSLPRPTQKVICITPTCNVWAEYIKIIYAYTWIGMVDQVKHLYTGFPRRYFPSCRQIFVQNNESTTSTGIANPVYMTYLFIPY